MSFASFFAKCRPDEPGPGESHSAITVPFNSTDDDRADEGRTTRCGRVVMDQANTGGVTLGA
jgi:hypothetical protein